MNKGGFSWKRAVGISKAKSRISRATGIPLTKSGRQRKVGRMVTGGGCCIPVIVLMLVFAFVLGLQNKAQSADINSFRGLEFGTELNDFSQYGQPERVEQDHLVYRKIDDKMEIGNAKVTDIVYGFYKNRFCTVMIKSKGQYNANSLLDTLTAAYGTPEKPNRYLERYFWFKAKVGLSLTYNKISDEIVIAYLYVPIMNEIEKDKKERAKGGVSDL